MLPVVERFIRYAKIHTESDRETGLVPSTPGQLQFAYLLCEERLIRKKSISATYFEWLRLIRISLHKNWRCDNILLKTTISAYSALLSIYINNFR